MTNNPPNFFISALPLSSWPPNLISTPLPEILVVIIIEFLFPASPIISASLWWFFAFKTVCFIFFLSNRFEKCSDLFILEVKTNNGCPFALHSTILLIIASSFSLLVLNIWSFESFLIICLLVGMDTTGRL